MSKKKQPKVLHDSIPFKLTMKKRIKKVHPSKFHEVTLILKKKYSNSDKTALKDIMMLPRSEREKHLRTIGKNKKILFHSRADHLKKVTEYMKGKGFKILTADVKSNSVRILGSHARLSNLFGINLFYYSHEGEKIIGHDDKIIIPAELTDLIENVIGFSEVPFKKNTHTLQVGVDLIKPGVIINNDYSKIYGQGGAIGLSGNLWANLYDFPKDLDGTGQAIGIACLCDKQGDNFIGGYLPHDMDTFFSDVGISKPNIIDVSVNNVINNPGKSNKIDGEIATDIQTAGSAASGAKIIAYFAPNSAAGMRACIEKAINDTENNPSILSISYGSPEQQGISKEEMDLIDESIFKANINNITVVVSAGDYGSTCNNESLMVQFPSSSQWVLCCGGTEAKLSQDYREISAEIVWNKVWDFAFLTDENNHLATGGGFSKYHKSVPYQCLQLQEGNYPEDARGIPDVSANACPSNYGYFIRVNKSNIIGGGTSAATPLWAALIARINQKIGNLGFVNPDMYEIFKSSPSSFTNISEGNNIINDGIKNYIARKNGWDPCTGLGSPNGVELLKAFIKLDENSGS